ncbi:13471_t:CDS:2, partial [Gigaspora rosea]
DKSVKTEQDVLTTHLNNSQVDITEELKRKKLYGVCKTCGTSFSDKAWCRTCEGQKLQKRFGEWTSGNEYVDNFIRNSQTKPLNKESYLSWIPYVNLSQVRYMANGGFSAVYHALWELENSYLIDVTMYLDAASQKSSMICCYGMTQHPTEGYMLVLEYADEETIENWVQSFDKPIYKKLPSESKDLVKQLKSADTLAKMQSKRQTEEPILLPPPPTHSASVFTSKPLSPFVTASDFQSIRKVSSVVSST